MVSKCERPGAGGVAGVLGVLLLCGCAGMAPQLGRPGWQEEARPAPPGGVWLLYVKGELVAEVEMTEPSRHNRVDVQYRGRTAEVTLRHRGMARLTPVTYQLAGGEAVVFQDDAYGGRVPLQEPLNENAAQGWLGNMQDTVARMSNPERVMTVQALGEPALLRLAHSAGGLLLLEQLYAQLVSSGSPGEEEARQAHRILETVARLRSADSFIQAVMSPRTMVFPYRASGATVLHSTPLLARVRGDGKVEVEASIRSYHPDNVEGEKPLASTHLELDAREVVGIKLYDEGGKLVFAPALFLVDVSNADERHTKLKMLEVAGLGAGAGLSLGAGVLMEAGVEAPLIPRVLMWCDEAALGLGAVTLVVEEQRGWILSRFGEEGRLFLRRVDGLNNAVALYGMVRVVMAAPRLVMGLRSALGDFLARARALEDLAPPQVRGLERLQGATEDFFREVDAIHGCQGGGELCGASESLTHEGAKVIRLDKARKPGNPPEAQSQPLPVEEEEPLAATGTGARLVPVRRQAAPGNEASVASLERGPVQRSGPRTVAPPSSTPAPASPASRSRARAGAGTKAPRVLELPALAEAELAPEVLEARLAEAEAAEVGDRMTADRRELWRQRPVLQQPPSNVSAGDRLWSEYVAYWYKRYAELSAATEASAKPIKAPLRWGAYQPFRQRFAEALKFQREAAAKLRAEALLPREQRELVGGFDSPLIEENVGVSKGEELGTFYSDMIASKANPLPGEDPIIETFSVKQRDLRYMSEGELLSQVIADAQYALDHYGGVIEIRRPTHPLFRQRAQVGRVHLIYDARMKPREAEAIEKAIDKARQIGVEVHLL